WVRWRSETIRQAIGAGRMPATAGPAGIRGGTGSRAARPETRVTVAGVRRGSTAGIGAAAVMGRIREEMPGEAARAAMMAGGPGRAAVPAAMAGVTGAIRTGRPAVTAGAMRTAGTALAEPEPR